MTKPENDLEELRYFVDNLDCLDAGPGSNWSCREGDGTGLWCETCKAAYAYELLEAEVERLRAKVTRVEELADFWARVNPHGDNWYTQSARVLSDVLRGDS